MSDEMNAVAERFKSGNSIPVDRTHITATEFSAIQQQLAAAREVQVTDEMVERAFNAMRRFDCFFIFSEDTLRGLIRNWLTDALNPR